MRCSFLIVSCLFLLTLIGCGGPTPLPTNPEAPTPLTLEAWKSMGVAEKYDPSSFDRLRLGDPQLKSEQAWENFMRTVVIPERKKDIPGVPGQPVN